jgi:hypothetical protein
MQPDQDALDRLQALSNYLSVSEHMMFREKDEYLWLKLRASGYEDAEVWAKVIERGNVRREEAWEIAKDMARNILNKDVEAVVQQFAEQLLVEQDIVPPTFTKWCECQTCGRMPVPERFEAERSPNCPWCLSGVSGI